MDHVTLEQRGFIHVRCDSCKNPEVWLRCQGCGKSDHFWRHEAEIDCDCGQRYGHASCLCGSAVPIERLDFVPFGKGPISLADVEVDWRRVAVLIGLVLAVLGGGLYYLWT